MKNKFIYVILLLVMFFNCRNVFAAEGNLSFSGNGSADKGNSYTINLNYSGSKNLASGTITLTYTNATCTISSNVTGLISNGNKINLNNVDGVGTSATLAVLTCSSSQSGTANFSVYSNDLYDVDVDIIADDSSSISNSKSVTINEVVEKPSTPTTPETPTTPQTPQNPTTPTTPQNPTTPSKPTTQNNQTTPSTPTKPGSQEQTISAEPTDPTPTPVPDEKDDIIVPSEPSPVKHLVLSSLDIVGYNINFTTDVLEYYIDVDSNVTDLYIDAKTEEEDATIDNIGKINIKDKDFVDIKLKSGDLEKVYTINLNRKVEVSKESNDKNFFLISFVINIILLIVIVFLLKKRLHILESNK